MQVSSMVRAGACAAVCVFACVAGAAITASTAAVSSRDAVFVAAEAWAFPKRQSPDPSVPKQAQAPKSCHGANLQGAGDIPYLAGRSPAFLARELILFRLGKRINPVAAPMRVEVSHLTLKDMIEVAAYAGSRKSWSAPSK